MKSSYSMHKFPEIEHQMESSWAKTWSEDGFIKPTTIIKQRESNTTWTADREIRERDRERRRFFFFFSAFLFFHKASLSLRFYLVKWLLLLRSQGTEVVKWPYWPWNVSLINGNVQAPPDALPPTYFFKFLFSFFFFFWAVFQILTMPCFGLSMNFVKLFCCCDWFRESCSLFRCTVSFCSSNNRLCLGGGLARNKPWFLDFLFEKNK